MRKGAWRRGRRRRRGARWIGRGRGRGKSVERLVEVSGLTCFRFWFVDVLSAFPSVRPVPVGHDESCQDQSEGYSKP